MFFKEERARYASNRVDVNLNQIIDKIINNEIDSAKRYIKIFLLDNNNLVYEYFIHNLIDIGNIKGNYNELIKVLKDIEKNNFEFKLSTYLHGFYNSLVEGNVSLAKIYLNIIDWSSIFGSDISILSELKVLMGVYENKIINDKVNILYNKLLSDGDFISLEDNEENLSIIQEFKKMNDIKIIYLNKLDSKKVYLVYAPYNSRKVDTNTLISFGDELFKKGLIRESLDKYLLVLRHSNKVSRNLFIKIAICYYRLGNYEKALSIIDIARYFGNNSLDKSGFDYDTFISNAQAKIKSLNK